MSWASLLSTYSYTSSLVAAHRYSSLKNDDGPTGTTFPLIFAAAYRNWAEKTLTFQLTETSQTTIQSLHPASDSNLAILTHGKSKKEMFCRLTDRETGRTAVTRLNHSASAPSGLFLATPSTVHNLTLLLGTDVESVKRSKFTFELCETPALATTAKVSALQSSILSRLSVTDVDALLSEYFCKPRYLLKEGIICLQVRQLITSSIVHVFNLLQDEEHLYFHVDELENGGDPTESDKGFFVWRERTRLTQGAHVRIELPREDLLANRIPGNQAPTFLARQVRQLAELQQGRGGRSRECLTVLLSGEMGSGVESVVEATAAKLGLEMTVSRCRDLVGETSGATEALFRREATSAGQRLSLWFLKDVEVLAKDREDNVDYRALAAIEEALESLPLDCLVVATCRKLGKVEAELARLFLHHREMPALVREDREQLLGWILAHRGVKLKEGVQVKEWARKAAGLNLADLEYLLDYAQDEADFSGQEELGEDHLQIGLSTLQATRADTLGLASVPSVRWEEVGGLEEAKEELARALEPGVGGRRGRTGVLLYGPPGVGKTLLAKAVATECSYSFISVKGPELLNMYVGQSEENVRQVFFRARQAQPCILFFDELDSLAPNRGGAGDGGGVMDRVVSALLAEMDALERLEVVVVAATNRPDLVDPALLRPGRLERLVYLGVTNDPSQQLLILTALTKKLQLAPDTDLAVLAKLLPPGLTGADLSSLVSEAALAAVQRCIQVIEAGGQAELQGVGQKDFVTALTNIRPSVSPQDLAYYENLNNSLRK